MDSHMMVRKLFELKEAEFYQRLLSTPITPEWELIKIAWKKINQMTVHLQHQYPLEDIEGKIKIGGSSKYPVSPSPEHKAVLITLKNSTIECVYMTPNEMMNYDLYVKAIQKELPTFDGVRHGGWQHWTSIRRYWMAQKVGEKDSF
jgi:hypothetical protein